MREKVKRMLKRATKPRRETAPIQYHLVWVGTFRFSSIAIPKLVTLFELYEHQNIMNIIHFLVLIFSIKNIMTYRSVYPPWSKELIYCKGFVAIRQR